MPADVRIQGHIAKALQFESYLTGGLPVELEIVVHYYAALHWVTATTILFLGRKHLYVPNFNAHETLKKAMGEHQANVGSSTEALYEALETLSRTARYSISDDRIGKYVDKAASHASRLRQWSVGHLERAGYICTPKRAFTQEGKA